MTHRQRGVRTHNRPADDPREGWVPIIVRTPLPLAVAGALTELIGSAWPSAVIDTSGRHGSDGLVMLVDPKPAPKRVTKKHAQRLAELAEEVDGDTPSHFLRFETDGTMVFAPSEEMQVTLGEIAHALMRQSSGPNYIEWGVTYPGSPEHNEPEASYVLSMARSKEQTPHALRVKAEAELEDLRAQVRALGDMLEAAEIADARDHHATEVRALIGE